MWSTWLCQKQILRGRDDAVRPCPSRHAREATSAAIRPLVLPLACSRRRQPLLEERSGVVAVRAGLRARLQNLLFRLDEQGFVARHLEILQLQCTLEDEPPPRNCQPAEDNDSQNELCALRVGRVQAGHCGHSAIEAVLPSEADEHTDGPNNGGDRLLRAARVDRAGGRAHGIVDLVEVVHDYETADRQHDGQEDAAIDRRHFDLVVDPGKHPNRPRAEQGAPRRAHREGVHDDVRQALGHGLILGLLALLRRAVLGAVVSLAGMRLRVGGLLRLLGALDDLRADAGHADGQADEGEGATEHQERPSQGDRNRRFLAALDVGQLAFDREARDLDEVEGDGQRQDIILGLGDNLVHHYRALAGSPGPLCVGLELGAQDAGHLEEHEEDDRRDDHREERQQRIALERFQMLHGTPSRNRGETAHVREQCAPSLVLAPALVMLHGLLHNCDLHAILLVQGDAFRGVHDSLLHGAHLLLRHDLLEVAEHGIGVDPLHLAEVHIFLPHASDVANHREHGDDVERAMDELQ
mmetsp:Transcript_173899/g.552071  ORF Transcript_173899/g.552071 Transcript_173899/m.552071 type:complete len:525 (-) Transcript_173899:324-1898(-)